MINRNIQMKKKNNDIWENLFPLTLTENVFDDSGKRLDDIVSDMDKKLSVIEASVKDHGMVGDGVTDDTLNFNTILKDFRKITIPKGTYIINPLTVDRIPSNTHLHFEEGAIFKSTNTNSESYQLIRILNGFNIKITGFPELIGDREQNHTTGEWGMGVSIRGSKNIYIENMMVRDFVGDGYYIGSTTDRSYCEDITLINPKAYNNRRQGMSVISCKNLYVRNADFRYTNGTPPEAGLDLEPNNADEFLQNIVFDGIYTENNAFGIQTYLNFLDGSTTPVDITINNHRSQSDNVGVFLNRCNNVKGHITFNNSIIKESVKHAVKQYNHSTTAPKILFNRLQTYNAVTLNTDPVVFFENGSPTLYSGNIELYKPRFSDSRGWSASPPTFSIWGDLFRDVKIIEPIEIKKEPANLMTKIEDLLITGGDKIPQLTENLAFNVTLDSSYSMTKTYFTNDQATALRTLSITSEIKSGFVLEVEVKKAFPLRIRAVSGTIYPNSATNTSNELMSSQIGAKVKLIRKSGAWYIQEIVGDWTATA